MTPAQHEPVLCDEVIRLLAPAPGQVVVDGTVGGGGHAARLLPRILPAGRLIGIDRDPAALAVAQERLAPYATQVHLVHGNYSEMGACLNRVGISQVDHILIDCGISSLQLDEASRGFGFQTEGPLDMRMDQTASLSVGEVLPTLSEEALTDILRRYGEEPYARRIARGLVQACRGVPITRTEQLAHLLDRLVPGPYRRRLKTKARVFQALRIHVNQELDHLQRFLTTGLDRLAPGGRCAVITFHSLEDRLVKQHFKTRAALGFDILTKKVIKPSRTEVKRNPRARSAKLRIIARCG